MPTTKKNYTNYVKNYVTTLKLYHYVKNYALHIVVKNSIPK